ncbi:hypothetical protein SADUNF_Sadunf16G0079600 [Salix dunnii]|uniref:Citrate synthase n=1 Tax=Salix dunnii TaxID=1413687 RepID=A0A835MIJ6_9ROSI|nr:hypothetical protein SADUNF_Sadunf16G0079600 [Salix dunnii]
MAESSIIARGRLAVLTAHLLGAPLESSEDSDFQRWCVSAQVPPPGDLKGVLTVIDERTGKKYQIQVSQDGTVKASDFKKISTGKIDKGLKLYDPGYLNTAPVVSKISYIDGDEGVLRYRGYPIEELAESSTFLEVAYLILYGNLPSQSQLADWEFAISQHSAVPQGVLVRLSLSPPIAVFSSLSNCDHIDFVKILGHQFGASKRARCFSTKDIIQAMPHDAHPMGVLVSAMSSLSIFHPDANPALRGQDLYNSKQVRDKQIARILGKDDRNARDGLDYALNLQNVDILFSSTLPHHNKSLHLSLHILEAHSMIQSISCVAIILAPTIAAAAYLRLAGRPPVLPSSNLSYSENFLYMLDSLYVIWGNRSYKPNPRLARVLDILFILHAEHEMNCSTSAARHLASSGVDVYTALAGAVGALYGPLHGGANEAVLKMLSEIGTVENIPDFIEGVKNRKRKMSGFGHRVYKNYDPRAKVIKKLAEEVFTIVGRDPLIEVAVALEKAALADEYFVKRKLYPNVDFYSGLIYRAMGFPTEFFPVLFAIPRMAGYLAHWRESLDDPDTKIMRPQQVYTGEWLRHYLPLKERMVQTDADRLGQVSISNASRRRLAGSGV